MVIELTVEQLIAMGSVLITVGAWVANYRAQVKKMRQFETMLYETRKAVRKLQGDNHMEALEEYISGKDGNA